MTAAASDMRRRRRSSARKAAGSIRQMPWRIAARKIRASSWASELSTVGGRSRDKLAPPPTLIKPLGEHALSGGKRLRRTDRGGQLPIERGPTMTTLSYECNRMQFRDKRNLCIPPSRRQETQAEYRGVANGRLYPEARPGECQRSLFMLKLSQRQTCQRGESALEKLIKLRKNINMNMRRNAAHAEKCPSVVSARSEQAAINGEEEFPRQMGLQNSRISASDNNGLRLVEVELKAPSPRHVVA